MTGKVVTLNSLGSDQWPCRVTLTNITCVNTRRHELTLLELLCTGLIHCWGQL